MLQVENMQVHIALIKKHLQMRRFVYPFIYTSHLNSFVEKLKITGTSCFTILNAYCRKRSKKRKRHTFTDIVWQIDSVYIIHCVQGENPHWIIYNAILKTGIDVC